MAKKRPQITRKAKRNEHAKIVQQKLGDLVRSLDAFGKAVEEQDCARHKTCMKHLGYFQVEWDQWREGK